MPVPRPGAPVLIPVLLVALAVILAATTPWHPLNTPTPKILEEYHYPPQANNTQPQDLTGYTCYPYTPPGEQATTLTLEILRIQQQGPPRIELTRTTTTTTRQPEEKIPVQVCHNDNKTLVLIGEPREANASKILVTLTVYKPPAPGAKKTKPAPFSITVNGTQVQLVEALTKTVKIDKKSYIQLSQGNCVTTITITITYDNGKTVEKGITVAGQCPEKASLQ